MSLTRAQRAQRARQAERMEAVRGEPDGSTPRSDPGPMYPKPKDEYLSVSEVVDMVTRTLDSRDVPVGDLDMSGRCLSSVLRVDVTWGVLLTQVRISLRVPAEDVPGDIAVPDGWESARPAVHHAGGAPRLRLWSVVLTRRHTPEWRR